MLYLSFILGLFGFISSNAQTILSLSTSGAASGLGTPAGNMWDIVAHRDIVITKFSIGGLSKTFSLYTRSGTFEGHEETPSDWNLLCSEYVNWSTDEYNNGMWYGAMTCMNPLFIPNGERRAFFLTPGTSIDNSGSIGDIAAQNGDLTIYIGQGFYSAWDESGYGEYAVQGVKISYYTVGPSASPTVRPTDVPTISPVPTTTTIAPPAPTSNPVIDTNGLTLRSLETLGAASGLGTPAGNMWDIVAKTDIVITKFSIGGLYKTFSLYTKDGTFEGYEENQSAWTLVCSEYVDWSPNEYNNGMWYGAMTCMDQLIMHNGERRAFYLTPGTSIYNGGTIGDIASENDDLQIMIGQGFYSPWDESGYGNYPVQGVKISYYDLNQS